MFEVMWFTRPGGHCAEQVARRAEHSGQPRHELAERGGGLWRAQVQVRVDQRLPLRLLRLGARGGTAKTRAVQLKMMRDTDLQYDSLVKSHTCGQAVDIHQITRCTVIYRTRHRKGKVCCVGCPGGREGIVVRGRGRVLAAEPPDERNLRATIR